MKSEQPTITRRQEVICGRPITIITRGEIETVRGAPKCRWCGKPLRPNYDTQRTAVERRHYFSKQPHGAMAVRWSRLELVEWFNAGSPPRVRWQTTRRNGKR